MGYGRRPKTGPAAAVRRPADDGVTENDVEEYLKLKGLVEEVADDVYKAMGGNKAAGTRVRKIMQEIKNTAQEVRKRILELRDEDGPAAPANPD